MDWKNIGKGLKKKAEENAKKYAPALERGVRDASKQAGQLADKAVKYAEQKNPEGVEKVRDGAKKLWDESRVIANKFKDAVNEQPPTQTPDFNPETKKPAAKKPAAKKPAAKK